MAKKSAAQLEREIGEVLSKPRLRGTQGAGQAARKAGALLADLTHNRYFTSIPLDEIFTIVERTGLQFDPEEKLVILTGRDGRATWDLYWEGRRIDHMLVLQWHKMDVTGRYELVAYVS